MHNDGFCIAHKSTCRKTRQKEHDVCHAEYKLSVSNLFTANSNYHYMKQG